MHTGAFRFPGGGPYIAAMVFNDFLDDMRATGEISEENYRKLVRENAVKLLGL